MKHLKLYIILSILVLLISNCKKEAIVKEEEQTIENINAVVLTHLSQYVAQGTYNDLENQAGLLFNTIQEFTTNPTDENLNKCKDLWKSTRLAWEQSEGFLFGPVSTNNIDPRIDTWPVNYTDLDSVLNSPAIFTDSYIDGLEDALKGFHPIEYLLFGNGGTKTAAQLTTRQKEYLLALAGNLKKLTADVAKSWNPSIANNFSGEFEKAGSGSSVYLTKRAAYEEIVNAMAGICDEVANGKIEEPFAAQDPSLEESPFASNSLADFINNIQSVQNVYLGGYKTDGKGLEDIVRINNLSLDVTIKNKINNAITALKAITDPFGKAISTQPVQIKNAQTAINELKDVLEGSLMPYLKTQIIN